MLNKLYILTIFFSLVTLKRNKGKLFKTTSPVDPEQLPEYITEAILVTVNYKVLKRSVIKIELTNGEMVNAYLINLRSDNGTGNGKGQTWFGQID